jgi:hypothetical protein
MFIPVSACIKGTKTSHINDLMLHLKLLEKKEQVKHLSNRRKEIIKIRSKLNKTELKKIQRSNKKS